LKAQVGIIRGVLPGLLVESLVFLGWCMRRGTRWEGDGDADYLPLLLLLSTEQKIMTAYLLFHGLQVFYSLLTAKIVHLMSAFVSCRICFNAKIIFYDFTNFFLFQLISYLLKPPINLLC